MSDMTVKGVDCAARVSAAAARTLVENGVEFVGRYLVPQSMWKALTKEEAERLRAAGLAILLCWEIEASRALGGADVGADDGQRARRLAQELGIPAGTAIYFAVDFCPQENEYDAVGAYIRAASEAAAPYRGGVYGSYYTVEAMARRNACDAFWQCVAWSNGNVSEHADAYQYLWSGGAESKAMAAKVGFDVDMDRCADMAGAGLWLPEEPWYADAMAWAKTQGLIRDGRPDDPVTRAELAMVLYRKFREENA